MVLGAQLVLALLVIRQFRLESRTFFEVCVLMVAGAAVNAALPIRLRLPLFAGVSIASVFLTLGLRDGAILVVLGLSLIGLSHLRVGFRVRVALILGLAAVLAVGRAGLGPLGGSVVPLAVWAVLGSMFMFRLALYLYALRTRAPEDPPPTFARTLAYFFMAPNVSFPLFPVVDYNTFTRNHYDRPALEIYQTGARWIARGLVHLLLYRVVYTHVANDPQWLRDAGDLLRYLLSTYLLYFRVSGSFHLIVGLVCLFGFRLPETHHLYFLAESFNDYWRRINIYWKDFMMKLVYYPSFFRLRKSTRRPVLALTVATVLVFFATWLLHSYQWFWLRGGFPLKWPDALFWGILGTFVVWNARREAQRGRKRVLSTEAAGWRGWRLSRAAKVVAMFTVICILWSLWSADSIFDWLFMWRAADNLGTSEIALLGGLLVGGLIIAGRSWDAPATGGPRARAWYREPALGTVAVLMLLLALTRPEVQRRFGSNGAAFLASLQFPSLNARDAVRRQRGYYEKMDVPGRLAQDLWVDVPNRPAGEVLFAETPTYRRRHDFLGGDLRPSTVAMFLGHQITTNRWGMRGADVDTVKRAGTVRVAALGPSYIFGHGVADSVTIPVLLSERLNRELGDTGARRFEVLNFGVSGHSLMQQLAMFDDRVADFSPDVVLIPIDWYLDAQLVEHLMRVVAEDMAPIPYPSLDTLLAGIGLEPGHAGYPVPFAAPRAFARAMGIQARMPEREVAARLRERADTLVGWSIAQLARSVRAHDAVPVVVVMTLLDRRPRPTPEVEHAKRAAQAAGMITLDIRDVYQGYDRAALRVSPWDAHPNPRANRLITDRLAAELLRQPEILQRLGHTP
jgi:D-alanyl-lipoteichoic acid acyltransferase DltB (MBOAT superfamily)